MFIYYEVFRTLK